MTSVSASREDWRVLSSIEQASPRGYPRYLFPFELQDNYNLEEIVHVLKTGWDATCQRFPTLRAEVIPDHDAKQAGNLKLKELDEESLRDIKPIVVKDLRKPGEFPTFADLKSRHFPVSALDENLLTRRYTWPAPGERIPIILIQLNFIQGGLILNWNPFHVAGDGKTFYTWTEVWAQECRRAQNIAIENPVRLPDGIFADRAHVMNPKAPGSSKKGRLEDHPQYNVMTDPANQLQKLLKPDGHVGQIFYFSEESLKRRKEDAYPHGLTDGEPSYISTNDALSVLAWRSVMAAQFPIQDIEGDPITAFTLSVDGRYRLEPPINAGTLGCFLVFLEVKTSLQKMLETKDVGHLAVLLRKAILNANNYPGGFTNDMITLVDRLENPALLVPGAFLDSPGLCCSQTTWAKFELFGLEWGPLLGNQIKAVRSPRCGIINGLQVVLPTLPDGGREVLFGIEERCLERLLNDPLLRKYAEPR
ncbi:hypothetical protein JX265_011978 [Neoarthrinium moseri]|uniref:Trichothecene 3-O-acetyltransferase-like N-terminal domain-containing protein n=1 Tax=Neoarthrinium moseri TaxID=1658444 RepID=A0A9P9WB16_9PEZI|nr:hypothetical protein JX265_011978 [Neoarthrinium moseri]